MNLSLVTLNTRGTNLECVADVFEACGGLGNRICIFFDIVPFGDSPAVFERFHGPIACSHDPIKGTPHK